MPVIVREREGNCREKYCRAYGRSDGGRPMRIKSSNISQKRRPRKSISSIIGPEKLARRTRCGGGSRPRD